MTVSVQHVRNSVHADEKTIVLTLLYFDIFNYPLTESEIVSYSPRVMEDGWQFSLSSLVEKQVIFFIGGFYCLHNKPFLIQRRTSGNALAQKNMKIAHRISKLISHFPFVRAVMLSGSISKGFMDEESDIDYFIITEPGRLWLVRGAMAIIRRLFLFNSHKYFCTNYFIDTENTEVEEKNIFTAIEVATLKVMTGRLSSQLFFSDNKWYSAYLPNHCPEFNITGDTNMTQRVVEQILPVKLLNRIDRWVMQRFINRWKSTYRDLMNDSDFSIAFQSDRHVSRSHPGFYQKKVIGSYKTKIIEFENQFGINLDV